MSQKQLFSVLLKAIGVWEFVGGLIMVPTYVASISAYGYENQQQFLTLILGNVLSYCGLRIIAGCTLFFLADWLASKAYPTKRLPSDERQHEDSGL